MYAVGPRGEVTERDYGTHTLLYAEPLKLEGGNAAAAMSPCLLPSTLGLGNVMVAPLKIHGGDGGSFPHS